MNLGTMLKQAREERGYSQSQIAEMTRILVPIIKGLEEEDFSLIVAPIYGRGFVKLYAECVGLDPKACTEAFMEAYNRRQQQKTAATDFEEAGEYEAGEDNTSPAAEETLSPMPPQQDIFKQNESSSGSPASRYAAPVQDDEPSFAENFRIPPCVWRLLAVIAIALFAVWLVFHSVRALYKATCTEENPQEQSAVTTETTAVEEETPAKEDDLPATPAIPREKRKIDSLPAFYID